MSARRIRIAMNGVTGRMGRNQHLERSIVAIRDQGGVELPGGERLVPEPVLVGRNADKLAVLADRYEIDTWTTELEEVLADPKVEIYFDSQMTSLRAPAVRAAIQAGKAEMFWYTPSTMRHHSLPVAASAARRGPVQSTAP